MSDSIYPPYKPYGQISVPSSPATYTPPAPAVVGKPVVGRPIETFDPAVAMIRQKIENLYAESPVTEAETVVNGNSAELGSKHQQVMASLQNSGKSLAEIQTAWHNYYVSLPDFEKYQVWQEFYVVSGANLVQKQIQTPLAPIQPIAIPTPTRTLNSRPRLVNNTLGQATAKIKSTISSKALQNITRRIIQTIGKVMGKNSGPKNRSRSSVKQHLQSLAFGLSCGVVLVVIYLFSFFNQSIIAPLIQPSRKVNDTPVIVNTASTLVNGGPKVIIPKINVEIPVDYSQTTTNEAAIETALESGIVHYPTTVLPGQTGNTAYFGHSSNNIFNPGKYKFAFVLLHQLIPGDTFYLSNNGQTYAYKVFSKTIVSPSDVGVLNPTPGHSATATLITCDPPGTSINRLVVVGDQISPDPGANTAAAPRPTIASAPTLPDNGPSLWSRIVTSIRSL